jgi:lipoprotein-anchoring transpeptidase ErfK/SrfK
MSLRAILVRGIDKMTRLFAKRTLRLPVLLACVLALAACVADPTTQVSVGTSAPAVGKLATDAYVARNDGTFVVPAVPVEKVPTQFQRQSVAYASDQPVGTIIINPIEKHLYLITGKNKALRYGIGVGRAGFEWSGVAVVTERKAWPTWTPPKEMIERKPELAKWEKGQPGSPSNPLGARALYLTTNGVDYGYRIHGTPEWFSIGKNASSGCIRMIHQDVIDLFDRVPVGTKVIVLTRDGQMPTKLTLPPKQPAKTKVKVAAKTTPAVVATPIPTLVMLPPPAITTGAPVVAPAVAPAATPAPAEATAPACKLPLVNGVCPPATTP